MINEQNFKQAIQEYAGRTYGEKLLKFYEQFHKEFPYGNPELDDEMYFRDFIDWLVLEKPLPDTGKTITEEFVEAHPELDAGMKEKLADVLAKVPEKSKDALRFILSKGGFAKYGALKDYDDYMQFWWGSEAPESDIGVLRLYGLLAVGKMAGGGKMYRIALVPYELRGKLAELLGN